MSQVLIVTRKDDPHADLVVTDLAELATKVFRLNTECATEYDFSLRLNGGKIKNRITSLKLDLDDVTAVYLRRRSFPQLLVDPRYLEFAQGEWIKLFRNIWTLLQDRYWMNSPDALESAKDKLHQLRVAQKIGFTVPDTTMTNSLDSVRELRGRERKLIYKAFDGGALYPGSEQRIYTTVLGEEQFEEEQRESLLVCPGIFQTYQEKAYELRVTVIRDQVIAVRIDSQNEPATTVDWRQGDFLNLTHTLVELDRACQEKCIQLLRELSLQFGSIDLIRTNEDEYVFLEINANGQWAWLQGLADAPISQSIARALAAQK